MKRLLLLMLLVGVYSCEETIPKTDFDKLKQENSALKEKISQLENTPDKRLYKANEYLELGDSEKYKIELEKIIDIFPESKQAEEAEAGLVKLEIKKEKLAKEKLEKERLGFKALKNQFNFDFGKLNFKVSNLKIGKTWIVDRYSDRYQYFTAERDYKYLSATVKITSKSKNPILPQFLIYKLDGSKLKFVSVMNYRFYRWKDYSTYLGNYSDKSNDFRYTKTINFTVGSEIKSEIVKNETFFILVEKLDCFFRKEDRFNNPPVNYERDCPVSDELNLDEALGNYFTIKSYNY